MESENIKGRIEAVLFACGDPVTADKLCELMETDKAAIIPVLREMKEEYENTDRGIRLVKLDTRWQLCTKEEHALYIKKALAARRNSPLSNAALEVLAIVAYNQPVTRVYIEQIRGVECSAVINLLVEKGLAEEKGRLDAPGRPLLYGTAANFLRSFGISSLKELPELPELETEEVKPEDEEGAVKSEFE